jgi:photosystem II stability/assembly factor-like uncharacterized protein
VVGDSGTILRTTDGGAHWIPQPTDTRNALWSFSFKDSNTGIAVGDRGAVLRTADGGVTWRTLHDNDSTLGGLRGVFLTDSNTGTAVGGMGIWRTTDGGITWNHQFSSTVGRMYSVWFTDANTGIAVGDSGAIVRTTTAGEEPGTKATP